MHLYLSKSKISICLSFIQLIGKYQLCRYLCVFLAVVVAEECVTGKTIENIHRVEEDHMVNLVEVNEL